MKTFEEASNNFFELYARFPLLVSHSITVPDNKHLHAMFLAIYNEIILDKQMAGSFIMHCVKEEWYQASLKADRVNYESLGVLIQWVNYLKLLVLRERNPELKDLGE